MISELGCLILLVSMISRWLPTVFDFPLSVDNVRICVLNEKFDIILEGERATGESISS